MKIIELIKAFAKSIIHIYIRFVYESIKFIEAIALIFMGEDFMDELKWRIEYAFYFYSSLWEELKKEIEFKLIVLIWKIKRSEHPIVIALKKFLSKFSWFNNNNIIKF